MHIFTMQVKYKLMNCIQDQNMSLLKRIHALLSAYLSLSELILYKSIVCDEEKNDDRALATLSPLLFTGGK